MKTFLVFLVTGLLSLLSCQMDSTFSCIGASTPVDLSLKNSSNKDQKLVLLKIINENKIVRIGTIYLKVNQLKTICLENEGPITDGLYIYIDGITSKIKLVTTGTNHFDTTDPKFRVESTEAIRKVAE